LLLLLFLLRNIFHSFLHSWLGMHGFYGVGYLTLLAFVIGNLLWSLILIFLLSLFDESFNQRKIATQVLPYLLLKLEKFLIILAGGWA
jgi:biotin transporter BioY